MKSKMFSKSIKLAILALSTAVITGCASNEQIESGKVVSVSNGKANVYLSADTATLEGKTVTVSRLLPNNSVLEGESPYSYQVVGKAVIDSEERTNYIRIKTNDIIIEKSDIIELTE